jgi:hypothetical protein
LEDKSEIAFVLEFSRLWRGFSGLIHSLGNVYKYLENYWCERINVNLGNEALKIFRTDVYTPLL